MMNEAIFLEVSDILESFDIDELGKLIKEQINDDVTSEIYTETVTDHLRPLYYNYAKLAKYSLDGELKDEAESRFYTICIAFLKEILKKFDITLSNDWLSDHYSDIPTITMAFYSFFVLDFTANVYELIVNYIQENGELVYKTFEGLKIKKDASTLANKKNLSTEMALIISNIYDIAEWILSQMDVDMYFDNLDDGYVPLKILRGLYNEGIVSGQFTEMIQQIFHNNIPLKSSICFKIIYQIKNGEIKDQFIQDKE